MVCGCFPAALFDNYAAGPDRTADLLSASSGVCTLCAARRRWNGAREVKIQTRRTHTLLCRLHGHILLQMRATFLVVIAQRTGTCVPQVLLCGSLRGI